MKHLLAFTLILTLGGCSAPSTEESNSATESYRQMLSCKARLAKLSRDAIRQPKGRSNSDKVTYRKSIKKFVVQCPSAKTDTYSAGYDPKTGTTYCQGHHHAKAGLGPDYPRIIPSEELAKEKKFTSRMSRNYAPQVVEDKLYSNQLPPGFPYPFPEGENVETLSSLVARDGTWHVRVRYPGDMESLYQTWLEISLKQINLSKDQVGEKMLERNKDGTLSVGGKTPLANEVAAKMNPKTQLINVRYQPKFLLNDLKK